VKAVTIAVTIAVKAARRPTTPASPDDGRTADFTARIHVGVRAILLFVASMDMDSYVHI
jgi:hypothetical protein